MDSETYEVQLDPRERGPGFGPRLGVWLGIAGLLGVGGVGVWTLGGQGADNPNADPNADNLDADVVPVELAGPYDGLESIGLPVVVDPSVGLVDGQTLQVEASGFGAHTAVAVVQCWGAGDGEGSVRNCDAGNYALANSDEQGAVSTQFVVRRFISTDLGEKDCAAGDPDRNCGIAVANIADYDESGVTTTYFDSEVAGTPAPVLSVEPSSGLSDGDLLTVTGTQFTPGETARITQCVMNSTGIPGCFGQNPTGEIEVDGQGNFSVSIEARRLVEGLAGPIDCVEDPYGCRVVVAGELIPNPFRITFAGDSRPPSHPSFTVSPSDGLVDGDSVSIEMTDLRGSDGAFVIRQCVDIQGGSSCVEVGSGTGVDGTISVAVVVSRELTIDDGSVRNCADPARRCYLQVETEYQEVERLPIGFEEVG